MNFFVLIWIDISTLNVCRSDIHNSSSTGASGNMDYDLFLDLPNEMIAEIFKYLDVPSRFRMRLNKRLDKIQLSFPNEIGEIDFKVSIVAWTSNEICIVRIQNWYYFQVLSLSCSMSVLQEKTNTFKRFVYHDSEIMRLALGRIIANTRFQSVNLIFEEGVSVNMLLALNFCTFAAVLDTCFEFFYYVGSTMILQSFYSSISLFREMDGVILYF